MHWLIQNNIYAEAGFEQLLGVLHRRGHPHSLHRVVPFVGELEPEPTLADDERVIVMGSYSMARYAARRGWKPAAFLDNLDFRTQRAHWGDRMLDSDALIVPFGRLDEKLFPEPRFVRPVHDTKAFTGQVIDWPEVQRWIANVRAALEDDHGRDDDDEHCIAKPVAHIEGERGPGGSGPQCDPLSHSTLTLETEVMVCAKKEIYTETRTWVVDGKVVTASGYKSGTLKRYTPPEMVEPRIIEFVQECADSWSPNRACVIDVFDTPRGLMIGEVNNLNSAGWYRADLDRLVQALEAMPWEP
jgi:hypothetical protein